MRLQKIVGAGRRLAAGSLMFIFLLASFEAMSQVLWTKLDSLFSPLPQNVHVYQSRDSIHGKPNIMYYVSVPLDAPNIRFDADTSQNRRLTPQQFYQKNDSPLLVVNAGFFTFADHRNLNAVVKDGKLVSFNAQRVAGKGEDSSYFLFPFYGTFGILENGRADVAWTFSDSARKKIYATQTVVPFIRSKEGMFTRKDLSRIEGKPFSKWKVITAVGGGPVLVQDGEVRVTNEEERKFYGRAIYDRHPRTAIGYTKDNQLIVFVCEGRSDSAAGLTLPQMARIMKEIGCEEALNLDGGGSTCLLVNGREVNTPSSAGVQRAIPSVFIVAAKP